MLIAHAPAGYIGAKCLEARLRPHTLSSHVWALCGVISGLLPDVDMWWFYVVDQGRVHHHRYVTHWPLLWLIFLLCALLWRKYRPQSAGAALLCLVGVNGMVHMMLDSIVGDIWWLMPWHDQPYALFGVAARYQPWWLNFVLHWSFTAEIAVWLWAISFLKKSKK